MLQGLGFRYRVVDLVALRDGLEADIGEAFDPTTHTWTGQLEERSSLIGKPGDTRALIEQMFTQLGESSLDRLIICSPYFDPDGEALRALVARVEPAQVTALVQAKGTSLTDQAWAPVGTRAELASIRFCREDDQGNTRDAFVHAKFYAFERGGRVTLLLGSANCSRAALTIPGAEGNAELLAIQHLSAEEFRSFLAELAIEKQAPTLPRSDRLRA